MILRPHSFLRLYSSTAGNGLKILRTISEVRAWRRTALESSQDVSLVPTMGALHSGHEALVQAAKSLTDKTIVSIFVNPSQFAPTEDLDQYPRTLDSDLELLTRLGADAVFVPSVEDLYPSGIPLDQSRQVGAFVTVQGLSEQLEGQVRPQFFRGVATVVTKLLNIVEPERVLFGQKDAQQCVVVKRLVKDLHINSVVHVVPTVREASGLALSSRNAYLTEQVRQDAAVIYAGLNQGLELYRSGETNPELIINRIKDTIKTKFNDIEYVTVSDLETLQDIKGKIWPIKGALISLAVRVPNQFGDQTRLIDNILL
ncbi:pantothenate synthase [Lipomyces japonicus]|uniref:pantothenate synthase n=2 Tax=Lipomyces japonicus TaxID=56871 RepID=UPI0034CE194E